MDIGLMPGMRKLALAVIYWAQTDEEDPVRRADVERYLLECERTFDEEDSDCLDARMTWFFELAGVLGTAPPQMLMPPGVLTRCGRERLATYVLWSFEGYGADVHPVSIRRERTFSELPAMVICNSAGIYLVFDYDSPIR